MNSIARASKPSRKHLHATDDVKKLFRRQMRQLAAEHEEQAAMARLYALGDDPFGIMRAAQLVHEDRAALARLSALADDPLDAMLAMGDLTSVRLHIATAERGAPAGPFPQPQSQLFRGMVSKLEEKALRVRELLSPEQLQRLLAIAPAFLRRLGEGDREVFERLVLLAQHEPEVIAAWLGVNLGWIESRLAS